MKRNLRITVFAVAMGVVALIGYLAQGKAADSVPTRVLLENGGGAVVFNHQKHASEYKVECKECHHTESKGKCGMCHGVEFDKAFVEKHQKTITEAGDCVACHHQGFTKSVRTHAMHSAEVRMQCEVCHHNREIEERPTNCGQCHKKKANGPIVSLETAAHKRCAVCHRKAGQPDSRFACGFCHNSNNNRERWAEGRPVDMGAFKVSCATCHKDPKAEELVPNRMSAFHGSCVKCHERRGKGPFGKKQCQQCHTN